MNVEKNLLFVELIILVIAEPRQLTIAQHRFPWTWFEPFYQYHLNLQYTLKQTSETTCLYISIMHKTSSLSKENIRYFGLEALLNGFDVPLTANQSIYAIGRIVPDYKAYKYVFFFLKGEWKDKSMKLFFFFVIRHDYLLDHNNQKLGVEFKKINFPNNEDFVLPDFSYVGYPQLSLASKDVCKINSIFHSKIFFLVQTSNMET